METPSSQKNDGAIMPRLPGFAKATGNCVEQRDDDTRANLAIAVGVFQLRPNDAAELQWAGRAHDAGSSSGSKGLSSLSSNHDCGGRGVSRARVQSISAADLSTSWCARISRTSSRCSSGTTAARSSPLRRTITGRPAATTWVSTAAYSWAACGSSTRPGSSSKDGTVMIRSLLQPRRCVAHAQSHRHCMELYQKRAPVGERFPPPLLDSIVLRARSLAGLASGTVIQNQATVVFDYNGPIDTPLVKNTDQRGDC